MNGIVTFKSELFREYFPCVYLSWLDPLTVIVGGKADLKIPKIPLPAQ